VRRIQFTDETLVLHNRPNSEILIFPDWEAPSDASPQAHSILKARCHDARPLGLMEAGDSQLLVVYECGSSGIFPIYSITLFADMDDTLQHSAAISRNMVCLLANAGSSYGRPMCNHSLVAVNMSFLSGRCPLKCELQPLVDCCISSKAMKYGLCKMSPQVLGLCCLPDEVRKMMRRGCRRHRQWLHHLWTAVCCGGSRTEYKVFTAISLYVTNWNVCHVLHGCITNLRD
jgi:hypothetical protein